MNEDERMDDDIAAQHRKEKLWSDEDQIFAEQAMKRDDAPIATSEVALTVTTLTPEALDDHLMALEPSQIAEFAVRAAAIARIAGRARQIAHLRLVEKGQTGVVFTDPADGTPYQLTGGRHRTIKNVDGLTAQLAAEGIDARPLIPWLSSTAFKVGQTIEGDERVKAAINEFAVWVDDPLTLVELDPRTMKAVRR